jgi:Glycosyl hydrolases family 25
MEFNPVIVDLSHFDNVRDWDAVKRFGILGVINKATEGPGLTDRTYKLRREPTRQRGILYGAYHFLRRGDPIAQADHFLDVALNDEQPDDLLLALDHEDRNVPLDNAKQWLKHVFEKTGCRAAFYSGFLIKEQLGNRQDDFRRHALCERSELPAPHWTDLAHYARARRQRPRRGDVQRAAHGRHQRPRPEPGRRDALCQRV